MNNRELTVLFLTMIIMLIVSGIAPYDRLTWLLEVVPVLIAIPILVATYFRFQFTPVIYRLILLHAFILMLGAHYTYERTPLGFWVQDFFHLAPNPYDRLGHFIQGFVPAMIVREILLRCSPLRPGKWLFFLVTTVCLSISACYELIEWWAAVILGESAQAFLGSQGDPWDTQWDMLMALLGALCSQLLLSGLQDKQLKKLKS